MIEVRDVMPDHWPVAADLHVRAFGPQHGPEIGELVIALHGDATAQPLHSLLAWSDGEPVGHVMFTHAWIDGSEARLSLLGPLGVVPEAQRRGAGKALVLAGLDRLRADGFDLALVLGVPSYYPQHGFEPATPHGLLAPYHDPVAQGDAWMVQALRPGLLGQITGQVCCAATFDEERFWRE